MKHPPPLTCVTAAMAYRCEVCFSAWLVLFLLTAVFATGVQGQCLNDYSRPLPVTAKPYKETDLFSPNYPTEYPNNADCQWKIRTDPGYVVRVRVEWISLEQSNYCDFDAITLFDGQTMRHPVIARLCSDTIADYFSSGHYLYVQFATDYTIQAEGFHLLISAILESEAPTTTTQYNPWWLRTTTAVSSGGGSGQDDWQNGVDTGAMTGGLTGGLLLLFVLCVLCRYLYTRSAAATRRQSANNYYANGSRGPSAPPLSHPGPGPHPHPATSTVYQNNNAVFMVSGSSAAPRPFGVDGGGGVSNLGFSPHGEAPPAYVAVHHHHGPYGDHVSFLSSGGGGFGAGGACPPPPSYTEAMRLSHPPALDPSSLLTRPTQPPPPPPPQPPPHPSSSFLPTQPPPPPPFNYNPPALTTESAPLPVRSVSLPAGPASLPISPVPLTSRQSSADPAPSSALCPVLNTAPREETIFSTLPNSPDTTPRSQAD